MPLQDFEKRLQADPAFLAQFLVDPHNSLQAANIVLTDPVEIKRLEILARHGQEALRVAADMAGFQPSTQSKWGIGAGCCNHRSLFEFDRTALGNLSPGGQAGPAAPGGPAAPAGPGGQRP